MFAIVVFANLGHRYTGMHENYNECCLESLNVTAGLLEEDNNQVNTAVGIYLNVMCIIAGCMITHEAISEDLTVWHCTGFDSLLPA